MRTPRPSDIAERVCHESNQAMITLFKVAAEQARTGSVEEHVAGKAVEAGETVDDIWELNGQLTTYAQAMGELWRHVI